MRRTTVTDGDVALLRTLAEARSIVDASRRVGISRDRATYRLARLEAAFGEPVVRSVRGGAGHGGTTLTPLGDRIVRGGFDSIALLDARPLASPSRSNLLEGTSHGGAAPTVDIGPRVRLRVTFPAKDGERVALVLDPEAILLARGPFPSSARNVLAARVVRLRLGRGTAGTSVVVRAGAVELRVAVTFEAVRQLRLAPGARVWLYVKATTLRRVGRAAPPPTRGSPRS